jgi:hypothetical protein
VNGFGKVIRKAIGYGIISECNFNNDIGLGLVWVVWGYYFSGDGCRVGRHAASPSTSIAPHCRQTGSPRSSVPVTWWPQVRGVMPASPR